MCRVADDEAAERLGHAALVAEDVKGEADRAQGRVAVEGEA